MKKKIIIILYFLLVFAAPIQLMAQQGFIPDPASVDYNAELVKGTPILPEGNLVSIIFRLIQYLLAFLGVIAMVVILYSGFFWMTSAGNDEKVSKAKKTLIAGVIGLSIVLLAFAIATFMINRIHDFSTITKE
jgi:hypothetical protein